MRLGVWALAMLAVAASVFGQVDYAINSMLAAFSLFDMPLDLQYRYELFHTAYATPQEITIVDSPLIPGQNVTQLVQIALSVKQAVARGDVKYIVNNTGLYVYQNGTLVLAITNATAAADGVSFQFGQWRSTQVDSNTWLNTTTLTMAVGGHVVNYTVLYYVRYVNETHRLYVITLAEMRDGGYGVVFTWANYWFKNKTVYFGDWVVVENVTLSQYYALLSTAVDKLAKKWQSSDKQYKPQAYPQISQALAEISRLTAGTDIDKPLRKGYALVTDLHLKLAIAVSVIVGVGEAYFVYRQTGNWGRAAACGLWHGVHTFFSIAIPNPYVSAYFGLRGWFIPRVIGFC